MGRGKGISEWPGNIHFRQVVNKYRDEYNSSKRKEKVKVADRVLQDVQASGGKFRQQSANGDWDEVDYERAIEKACQALREKEKSRPPQASPFAAAASGGKKNRHKQAVLVPPTAPASVRPATSHRKTAQTVLALKHKNSAAAASAASRTSSTSSAKRRPVEAGSSRICNNEC